MRHTFRRNEHDARLHLDLATLEHEHTDVYLDLGRRVLLDRPAVAKEDVEAWRRMQPGALAFDQHALDLGGDG